MHDTSYTEELKPNKSIVRNHIINQLPDTLDSILIFPGKDLMELKVLTQQQKIITTTRVVGFEYKKELRVPMASALKEHGFNFVLNKKFGWACLGRKSYDYMHLDYTGILCQDKLYDLSHINVYNKVGLLAITLSVIPRYNRNTWKSNNMENHYGPQYDPSKRLLKPTAEGTKDVCMCYRNTKAHLIDTLPNYTLSSDVMYIDDRCYMSTFVFKPKIGVVL